MPKRPCRTCTSPERATIEATVLSNRRLTDYAASLCKTSRTALERHMSTHTDEPTRARYSANIRADLDAFLWRLDRRYGVRIRTRAQQPAQG